MLRRFTIITVCSIFPLMVGCIPAAFVVGATAGGAVVYDKRNVGAMLDDNGIAKRIQYQIDHDPMLRQKDTHIVYSVFNHVVLLVGEVPDDAVGQRAYELVMNIKNVKRVYNQLEVRPKASLEQRAEDTWITSEVKTMMLARKGLHSTQIKVITEDNIVYLMGVVTRKQAALAADSASHVKGVIKVVKVFEYEE